MRKLIVATAMLFAATAASAQLLKTFDSSTLYWENDNFGVGRKSDRFYTNGVRYTATISSDITNNWQWPLKISDRIWKESSQPLNSIAVAFGQNFYTPQIITIAAPQPQDRPWAGILYGGLSQTITDPDQKLSHLLELQIGILGPGAGAQRTQKYVHNTLGFSNHDPQGWDNQLKNEPAISLMYQQMRRELIHGEWFDAVPSAGATIGSPQTSLNVGGTIRLGYHISGLPVGNIRQTASGLTRPRALEFYFFAGGEGRFVPFNATLDGGLFRNGPKANGVKRFVGDFRRGFSGRYHWVRLTYTIVDRSKEFDVPPGAIATQRFGSFALTIEPFDSFR